MSKYIYYEESDFDDIEESSKEELIEELKHTYLVKLNEFIKFLEEEEIKSLNLTIRINKAIELLKLCNSQCSKEVIEILKGSEV